MNRSHRCTIARFLPVISVLALASALDAQQWTPPTPEELKMTSQPEVPGAAAVYLFKEETTEDRLHMWSKYVRLKVLTEAGKEYANVELRQYDSSDSGGYTVGGIAGRTIHPDGTIIPFTGKPLEKLIEKGNGFKEMSKVFTLPDVEVGSIIEYRYQLRYDDNWYISPSWIVQTDLFTRNAHYIWKPTNRELVTKGEHGEQLTSSVAWMPILPSGAEVKQSRMPPSTENQAGQLLLELNVKNVPPNFNEEFMPPIRSLTYRVLFYYSAYRSSEEFWKNEGKGWSKTTDKFIGPGNKVKEAVRDLAVPSDTPDQKLRKFYEAVMKIDNTNLSGVRSAAEEKAQGLGPAKSTDDIWERKRGHDDEIAELFIAMARAAGFKAYAMRVTNRDSGVFVPGYLSFGQLEDTIAIVVVDGKEQFFDPGQRYCAYGHLAWKHTMAQGIRQNDNGTAISQTSGEPYNASRTQRVANLNLDENGVVAGTLKMAWTGDPALSWRHAYLRGDTTSLNRDLRTSMENMMPNGMDIKVLSIDNLEDYEKPLQVNYTVKGPMGSPTGKRLLLPSDLFESNTKPTFPHEKRDTNIFFNYPHVVLDALRINFPATFSLESAPASEQIPFQKFAAYMLKTETTPTSVTIRREFDLGNLFYKVTEYPDLRAFYNKFETKDQEPIVLKAAALSPTGN
ncbi:MAG: DUF3857 and transglutaminase domain-containing protein [Acidobacteriota bacterium]|nr:DUF3857 and transglutaminase domain-containing protein [Acidobacteriota bacterium]